MKVKSIFFLSLFLLFIVTPVTVNLFDINEDVSAFFSTTEEEEKNNKKNIKIEILFSKSTNEITSSLYYEVGNSLGYFFKNYTTPHLHVLSPPPDLS